MEERTKIRLGIHVDDDLATGVLMDEDGTLRHMSDREVPGSWRASVKAVIEDLLRVVPRGQTVGACTLSTSNVDTALTSGEGLERVGVVRAAGPASTGVPPGMGWPAGLARRILAVTDIVPGGHDLAGEAVAVPSASAVHGFADRLRSEGGQAVAVTSPFSFSSPAHEESIANLIRDELGASFPVSVSHKFGSIGLLERENVTILNSALLATSRRFVRDVEAILVEAGIGGTGFLTQHNGCSMRLEDALRHPVLTAGSRFSNSMLGAGHLAGYTDAVVVGVDDAEVRVGLLEAGFPKLVSAPVEVAGVRTHLPMPDTVLLPLEVGGGATAPLPSRGRGSGVGGSGTGRVMIGAQPGGVVGGFSGLVGSLGELAAPADGVVPGRSASGEGDGGLTRFLRSIDRVRAGSASLPVVVVGAEDSQLSSYLADVVGAVRLERGQLAAAVGAAMAEAAGFVDNIYRYEISNRSECIAEARAFAECAAFRAGAVAGTVRVTSLVEMPLTYLPDGACRVAVRASGARV